MRRNKTADRFPLLCPSHSPDYFPINFLIFSLLSLKKHFPSFFLAQRFSQNDNFTIELDETFHCNRLLSARRVALELLKQQRESRKVGNFISGETFLRQQTHPLYLICDFRKMDKKRRGKISHTHTHVESSTREFHSIHQHKGARLSFCIAFNLSSFSSILRFETSM